ncbi:sulfotransferase family protein [Dyella solisilvae]|uniref:Sulfotransferase family protein n=1 Tax=Dyella solisilvae TaxID=1920168 RepID=A0A370K7F3_9GAMM|nr:tetratricopeptide repeat-containing sulfotransferase family protein [Dyella solisilvae]RDI98553.1 sulfotransferase family protein [Dyella solisilvae]
MSEHAPIPSSELVASIVTAFNHGDMARVLALGEPVAERPDTDDLVLLLLGFARQSAGRFDDSANLFRRLTEHQPAIPEYWNNLGIVARQAGDLATAEHALATAASLAPGQAETLYNLGLLYAQQQRWLLARETQLRAVELAPAFIEARLQAAHACHYCGDQRGAEVTLEGAADWPPQPADQALILASMLSSQGDQDAAFRALEQAVLPRGPDREMLELRMAALRASMYERNNQLEPAQAELSHLPLSLLDTLPAEQRELHHSTLQVHASIAARLGQLDQAAAHYTRLLDAAGESNVLANAAFGLAATRNKQGRREETWQALQQAHAWQVEFAKDFVPELLAAGSQPLDMVNHRVGRLEFDRWAPLKAPSAQQSPVFVVGFPRSGTTLLEQMLDAHPDFRSMDERAFVFELTKRMQLAGQSYPADLATLTQGNTAQLRDIYAGMVQRVAPDLGERRLIDKNPLNMLCLPMIARLYPEARIILCLRHPCDVLLSCFMQPFRSPPFMVLCSSLQRLAEGYVQAFEQWFHHVEVFAPRVLEWRYESVVDRFDDHVARLGQFLDVADAAPMTRFAEHARAKGFISTPSYAQVTEGIHRKAVNRWHAYREHFEPVLPILRPMLERLGYEA